MERKKYVDESWKEQATEEKSQLSGSEPQGDQGGKVPELSAGKAGPSDADQEPDIREDMEVNFLNYITSLGYQAMIFMGEIPSPVTNKIEKNLTQAKFLIDTLSMLKDKTAGNLNEQEQDLLENSVYELQLRYIQIIQQEGAAGGSGGQ